MTNVDKPIVARKECGTCEHELPSHANFCPSCGDPTELSDFRDVQRYMNKAVEAAVTRRVKDQTGVIREIADKADNIVQGRYRNYAVIILFFVGIIAGLLAFIGVSKFDDLYARVEPLVSNAENRIKEVQKAVADTERSSGDVRKSLDRLSMEASNQAKRISDQNGDVGRLLTSVEESSKRAEVLSVQYQDRLTALSNQLDEKLKGLETHVSIVNKQIDNVTIKEVYPTLGQPQYITYMSNPWKGKNKKIPDEIWVNIFVNPQALTNYSSSQIENLMDSLKKEGMTPLIGSFGMGGAINTLDVTQFAIGVPLVRYFEPSKKAMAQLIADLATRAVGTQVQIFFEDISHGSDMLSNTRRQIITEAGLDAQILLSPPQPPR